MWSRRTFSMAAKVHPGYGHFSWRARCSCFLASEMNHFLQVVHSIFGGCEDREALESECLERRRRREGSTSCSAGRIGSNVLSACSVDMCNSQAEETSGLRSPGSGGGKELGYWRGWLGGRESAAVHHRHELSELRHERRIAHVRHHLVVELLLLCRLHLLHLLHLLCLLSWLSWLCGSWRRHCVANCLRIIIRIVEARRHVLHRKKVVLRHL